MSSAAYVRFDEPITHAQWTTFCARRRHMWVDVDARPIDIDANEHTEIKISTDTNDSRSVARFACQLVQTHGGWLTGDPIVLAHLLPVG